MTKPDGYDRLGERANRFAERQAGNLADRPGWTIAKWVLAILAVVTVLGLVGGVIGIATGYFDEGKKIVSVQNHKKQSYDVRENWNSMLTAAQNACDASGGTQTSDPNLDPQIIGGDPALTYGQTYRKIRTEYNRAQDNPYENGVINAGGYPKHVYIFPEERQKPVDWCGVADELEGLHR